MTSTYYWRAVRRIAKRYGISIAKARKRDWEKEANAERKRRSKAHQLDIRPIAKRKVPKVSPVRYPKRAKVPGRVARKPESTRAVPSRRVAPELIEEDEEGLEYADDWHEEYESDFEELNDLDRLDEFLEDFEYEDSDKYKEPS